MYCVANVWQSNLLRAWDEKWSRYHNWNGKFATKIKTKSFKVDEWFFFACHLRLVLTWVKKCHPKPNNNRKYEMETLTFSEHNQNHSYFGCVLWRRRDVFLPFVQLEQFNLSLFFPYSKTSIDEKLSYNFSGVRIWTISCGDYLILSISIAIVGGIYWRSSFSSVFRSKCLLNQFQMMS